MATYVKLSHNGTINTIALLEGLNAEELNDLLQTVFNVSGKIVGLMANKGLVLPLTLVAKNPQIIPANSVCKILISSSTASTSTLPSATTSLLSNNPSNASLPSKNEVTQEKIRAVSEDNDDNDDDDSVEYVTQDIIRFINGLKSQKFITNKQYDLLIDLLSENSSLLFAGYSVAVSANDSEYFAEICKDIANSLVTENGRASCEVQDEILQLCDQLYINGNVTENQLLYLRHLTLIRDESVATLYDEYQEHQSVPLLAKALYVLANTHPYQTSEKSVSEPNSEAVEDEEDDEEEEETDDNQGSDYPESDSQSQQKRDDIATSQKGLIGVISLMTRSFVITKTEASILLDMVDQENEYVLAAYELYERNRNLDDLQDTLLRCVKLEVRKRVTDIQEKELGSLTQESQTNFTSSLDEDDNRNGYTEDDEGDEDDDEEDDDDDEEQEDSVSKQDDESDNFSLEDITLDSILISLGVQNIWKETVPETFLHTVFIAVVRRQLDLDQAKAVCDLFHAKYDNVLSAWEVYTVQQDANDFIDTLRRIVRDINGQDVKPAATSSASNAPTPKSPPKETTASRTSPTKQSPSTTASSPNKSAEQELTDRKNEAMKAVSAAKKELLKHSLEMMVKQGITTAKKASDLYGRYLANDPLVDAAIEAYASDRDVSEFLDTLQILANHSQEELDTLMSMAKDDEEDDEPEKETPAPQPTKSNQTTSATSSSTSSTSTSTAASTDINPSDVDEIALLQVADIVNEMLKNDMIGPSVAEQFYNLIQAHDQRLIDAYNTYLQTKSGANLVDSLLRIVIASVEEMQKKVPSSSSTASPARNNTSTTTQTKPTASPTKQSTPEKQSTQASATTTKEPSPNSKQALLDHEDQKTVVDILVRAQAITKEQQTTLYRMVEHNDPIVASIFVKYETDKNVYGLIDSLKSLVLFDQEMGGDDEEEDDEEEEDAPEDEVEPEEEESESNQQAQAGELEDDDEEEDENFNEDDRDIIEHKFLEIIQKMNLNELETAALRLAIAENDPKVRAGIDSFRESQNEQLLMMSLKSAAQDVIMRILSNKSSSSNDDDDEEDENKRDEDDEDDDDNDIEERLKDLNEEFNPYSSRSYLSDSKYQDDLDDEDDDHRAPEDDEDMQEDSEDYNGQEEDDEDGGDDNEQSTSLLTSQAARDHVFPILVDELVKENILSNKHGKVILQEFAANNPVIGAALDIYDIDNDMAQLVESLQELADNLTRNYD